jgi:biopolymer transport protein ExbD
MRIRRKNPLEIDELDLTAFVDVVMLLLAFFLMGSTLAAVTRQPLDLPRQPGEASPMDTPATFIVDAMADGTFRVAGRANLSLQEVLGELEAHRSMAGPDGTVSRLVPSVVMRAEASTKSGQVAELAKELARAGIKQWQVATSGDSPSIGSARP